MPAQIYICCLLLTSEQHREALLKVLNEAHVLNDISIEFFVGIVGKVFAANQITFS